MRLALVALLLLSGCAQASYWTLVASEVPFTRVIETDTPGGRHDLDGYANRDNGEVEVRQSLRPILKDCVISHEKKHLKGYAHMSRRGFATDCGDGTIVGTKEP